MLARVANESRNAPVPRPLAIRQYNRVGRTVLFVWARLWWRCGWVDGGACERQRRRRRRRRRQRAHGAGGLPSLEPNEPRDPREPMDARLRGEARSRECKRPLGLLGSVPPMAAGMVLAPCMCTSSCMAPPDKPNTCHDHASVRNGHG